MKKAKTVIDEILKLQNKEWLNPDEVERLYGFKKNTQAKWRMKNLIPYHKIGRFIKYNHDELRNWMKNGGTAAAKRSANANY